MLLVAFSACAGAVLGSNSNNPFYNRAFNNNLSLLNTMYISLKF